MQFQESGTPIPRTNEKKTGAGPVESYQLPEDQLQQLRNKMIHKSGLTRDELINLVGSGFTLSQIERKKNMKPNEIYHWVKKWDLQGIGQKEAKRIMNTEAQEIKPIEQPEAKQPEKKEQKVNAFVSIAEVAAYRLIIERLQEHIETAEEALTDPDIDPFVSGMKRALKLVEKMAGR